MKKLALLIVSLALLVACAPASISPKPISPIQSSDTEPMSGYLTLQDGRLVEYKILIPKDWNEEEKIEYRKEGNTNYFDYRANPKYTLFSIAAFTEAVWQEIKQEPGHGEQLLTQDGIVYVYNIALDNPYAGSQAEEFQKMAEQVQNVVSSLSASIISTAAEMEEARNVLVTFFNLLSEGNYAEATELYGGTYENLSDMNPEVDPNDHAALLKNACAINGFQCLQIKEIVQEIQDSPTTFIFTLEFSNPDGSLFVLNACCGATGTETPPQSRFDYIVNRVPQLGNIFLVQWLPVYVP